MTTPSRPPILTSTSKFSVLGECCTDPAERKVHVRHHVASFDTDILHQKAKQCIDNDSIPQALYCGIPVESDREQQQPTTPLVVLDESLQKVVEQWKAFDEGTLCSLPMEKVSNGEALVEHLRSLQCNDNTIQLAEALYCGLSPQSLHEPAPHLGDIVTHVAEKKPVGEKTVVVPVQATVTERHNREGEAKEVMDGNKSPPLNGNGTVQEFMNAEDDPVLSTFNKWKDVENGKLQSLPMECLTNQQLEVLIKRSKGVFSQTTMRHMSALYGDFVVEDQNPSSQRKDETTSSVDEFYEPSEDEENESATIKELVSNGGHESVTKKSASENEPGVAVESLQNGEEQVKEHPATTKHDKQPASMKNKQLDGSTSNPIADPETLASLWSAVDAGMTRSLPIQDVSQWSAETTTAFFAQLTKEATVSAPTVANLMDPMYQFSTHSDSTVRERYQELVARCVEKNPTSQKDKQTTPNDEAQGEGANNNSPKIDGEHTEEAPTEPVPVSTIEPQKPEADTNHETPEAEEATTATTEPQPTDVPEAVRQKLVVLFTSSAMNRQTKTRQDLAFTVLDSVGVAYDKLDGAEQKELRRTLVGVSGLPSIEYPLFFLINVPNGEPTYWGNWDDFSQANENKMLLQEFGTSLESEEHNEAEAIGATSVIATTPEHDAETDESKNSATDSEINANEKAGDCKPSEPTNLAPTARSIDPTLQAKEHIELADSVGNDLPSIGNSITTVSSPQLSRANTPILSNRTADKEAPVDSINGGSKLEQLLEDSLLPKQPITPKPVRPAPPSYSEMTKKLVAATRPPTPKETVSVTSMDRSLETTKRIPEPPAKTKSARRFVASLSAVVNDRGGPNAPPTPAKSIDDVNSPIIILVSSQATHAEVVRQQNVVTDTLTKQGIDHVTVDAAERSNKAIRNALFDISQSYGEYPQIFSQDSNGQKLFWGGYDKFVVDDSLGVDISTFATKKKEKAKRSVKFASASSGPSPTAESKKKTNKMSADDNEEPSGTADKAALPTAKESAKSDITFYGSTSFVAKHALDYMMQVSLSLPGTRKVTLAGRNEKKVTALKNRLKEKMTNLCTVHSKSKGKCLFDTFIADSTDVEGLRKMCQRTRVVANFAGPFEKYSENVVSCCAEVGTDYVDITGEVSWSGKMRTKYGDLAEKSGARIISFCGFDSIPSDLAIFGAVDALKKKSGGQNVEIVKGTCWHHCFGMANGGTIQTAAEMPLNLGRCLFRWVPFLLDDPLALAHPRVRVDPDREAQKNRMARAEWINQLPSMDLIFVTGFSGSFFMAPVNTKIVNASSVALGYGSDFIYRERFIPVGFSATRGLGLLSLIPVLITQFGILAASALLKFPILGGILIKLFCPPGTGVSDLACQQGFTQVYSEVETMKTADGKVDRANCALRFEGDPGNWATAQCVCESALSLVLDRQRLPPKSVDGFGTPAELLGNVLLKRLKTSTVRPVEVATYVRRNTPVGSNGLCHFA